MRNRHRYFSKSAWAMDEKRLQKLENLFNSINFQDKVYDYVYLFQNSFNMSILHPIPFDEKNSARDENEKLKEKEVEKKFRKFKSSSLDLGHLIELVDKNNYNNLGMYIAKYYTDGNFDSTTYNKLIGISGIKDVICSYVCWIYANGDKSVIKRAKLLSKNYDGKDDLYVDILKIEKLVYKNHPQIMDEDDNIKQLYWSKSNRYFAVITDKDTLKWILTELEKYNNSISYIEYLYEGLQIFEPEEVLQYMINLKQFSNIQCNDKYNEIMLLEWSFKGIMGWKKMKCTQYIFKKYPQQYAQIIDLIYLHEGEEKGNKTTEESKIVQSLFDFYYKALFCPCENDGDIDTDELKEWVRKFREELKKQKQLNLLGDTLGRLFAYSPVGKDGYYPHEAVREIIEELADDRLRSSYIIAERNKRGVYSPDAGKTEKEMALKYKENADGIRILYSESAKIYDSLYEIYYQDSEAERRRAEDEW